MDLVLTIRHAGTIGIIPLYTYNKTIVSRLHKSPNIKPTHKQSNYQPNREAL